MCSLQCRTTSAFHTPLTFKFFRLKTFESESRSCKIGIVNASWILAHSRYGVIGLASGFLCGHLLRVSNGTWMIPGGVLVLHDRFLGIVHRYGRVARLLKISSIQIRIYTPVTPFTISAARAFSLFFCHFSFWHSTATDHKTANSSARFILIVSIIQLISIGSWPWNANNPWQLLLYCT